MLVHEVPMIMMVYYFIIAVMIFEMKLNTILYDNMLVNQQVLMVMVFYYLVILSISCSD